MKINYLKWSLHHVAIHFYMEGKKKKKKPIWQLKKKKKRLPLLNFIYVIDI